ncbi:MAG: metalloregulator ArsR/SmtB family transcription factor [Syntrophales bacterium]|nr:metalloregulator ArsR/SmtB family transcription factor [Syntrophales bacterium]
MNEFLKVIRALADKNRLKILKLLEDRELCVCEMQALLGIAQPTVSKHLKVLEKVGLVQKRKDGLWVNYTLNRESKDPYIAIAINLMKDSLNEDISIIELLSKSKHLNRELICKSTTKPR